MKLQTRLIISISILIVLVGLLNYEYFWKQIYFVFHKPQTQSVVTPIAKENPKSDPNILKIPSLNITAPIVYVEENNEAVFQTALVNGVVHFPGTAQPGQVGNCYIFGHSSDYAFSKGNYKTVFALLPKIKVGDLITVTGQDGSLFTYKVVETKIVKPNDLSVIDQNTNNKKVLSVQTSYPVGTALRRFVVIAEIVE